MVCLRALRAAHVMQRPVLRLVVNWEEFGSKQSSPNTSFSWSSGVKQRSSELRITVSQPAILRVTSRSVHKSSSFCMKRQFTTMLTKARHRFQSSWCSDSLRAGWCGDQIPVGARFSAPVQTNPGATQHAIQWVPGLSRG